MPNRLQFCTGLALAVLGALNLAAAERLCADVPELNAAFNIARPGDVITMREGTWTDADIRFEGEGTAKNPITLRAATPGKVLLPGRSRVRFSGRYLVVDGPRFDKSGEPSISDVVE